MSVISVFVTKTHWFAARALLCTLVQIDVRYKKIRGQEGCGIKDNSDPRMDKAALYDKAID